MKNIIYNILFLCVLSSHPWQAEAADDGFDDIDLESFDPFVFEDRPLPESLSHPAWFKLSFLELAEDLREAAAAGKGLVLYFGQKDCAYCRALLEVNFGKPDIVTYTRTHFDVIGIDIHGDRMVVDLEGVESTESDFSSRKGIDFTPTLVFYTADGNEAFRLEGYYPPYKFRAALEYVADEHYRREPFRQYLARADVPFTFAEGELNLQEFFLPGPYALNRSQRPGERPLAVFFEQPDCHACDVLHTGPLRSPEILQRLRRMEAVQLNLWAATPVITPQGRRTTARAWAEELGLFYTPTVIFFDRDGREILRLDSVVQFYRLRNVLDYVLSGAWREYPTFQQWRKAQGGSGQ